MDRCVWEPGWEFCNNNAHPPRKTTWHRNFLGILILCGGLRRTLGGNAERISHTCLQECLLHREELACREKTHSLLLCSAWTPQQHTHYHSLLGTHRVTAVCEEEVPVLFINQSPLAASVLQSFSWFKWIFNKSNTEYLQLPALFVICHTGAQRWKGEDVSAFMLKMHLSKEIATV